ALGVGTFNHSGGVHIVSNGPLKLGGNSLASGFYDLTGGALNANTILVDRNGQFSYGGGDLGVQSLLLSNNGRAMLSSGAHKVLQTTSLTIDAPGASKLDLTDNDAIINYLDASPLSTIKN